MREVISGSCSPLVLRTVDQAPVWPAGGDEVGPGDRGESLDDQVQANIPSKTQQKSERSKHFISIKLSFPDKLTGEISLLCSW